MGFDSTMTVQAILRNELLDAKTCPICIQLDGIMLPADDPRWGGELGSYAHPSSYAKDVEIYTENGWQLVSDIKIGDRALSLNPESFDLEYVSVKNLVSHYQEKMISFQSRNFDLLVTPEHDMFCRLPNSQEWGFVQAKNIPFNARFYRSSKWRGQRKSFIDINGQQYKTEDFVQFLASWLSDGCATTEYRIVIAKDREKRHEKYEAITEITSRLFDNVSLGAEKIQIKNRALWDHLRQFGYAHEKYIPDYIKALCPEQIRLFLDAYCQLGDGSVRDGKPFKGGNFRNEIIYCTSSKRMADDIGELLIKVGRRPSYHLKKSKGIPVKHHNGTYVGNYDMWNIRECYGQVSIVAKDGRHGIEKKEVQYDDNVFCVKLEKFHTLLVRRNGRVTWCGNCRAIWVPILDTGTLDPTLDVDIPDVFKKGVAINLIDDWEDMPMAVKGADKLKASEIIVDDIMPMLEPYEVYAGLLIGAGVTEE